MRVLICMTSIDDRHGKRLIDIDGIACSINSANVDDRHTKL